MSDDQPEKDVSGVVTAVYRNADDENKPCNVYLAGDDARYSTFDAATAEPIEEGVAVAFDVEENDGNLNIISDSVEVIDDDPDTGGEVFGSTDDGEPFESPRDRSIRCNVALKQAREFCQPLMHEDVSEARVEEIRDAVIETADVFAEQLREMNRSGGEA